MEICISPDFNRKTKEPVVVAIGSFDGIHLGHQKIINKTIEEAETENISSGIYSFIPHPLKVVNQEEAPGHLLSKNQKERKIEKLGVDYYFKQRFTKEFSEINFETFVKKILVEKINVHKVVVGKDFRFGKNATGNNENLLKLSKKYDFEVEILTPLKIKNKIVSSSYIRNLIKKGEVEKVPDYLGSYYELEGKVITGEGRGRRLGYPTANLDLTIDYILPPPGVYAGYVTYNGNKYKAIGNLGYNPTFSGDEYHVEIYITNFSQNIYDELISFEVVKFLRREEKFEDENRLIQQIKRDILYTENILW